MRKRTSILTAALPALALAMVAIANDEIDWPLAPAAETVSASGPGDDIDWPLVPSLAGTHAGATGAGSTDPGDIDWP